MYTKNCRPNLISDSGEILYERYATTHCPNLVPFNFLQSSAVYQPEGLTNF